MGNLVNDAKYSVYMLVFPDNKKYIGMTSQKTSRRWKSGAGYKSQKRILDAINECGWENIRHTELYLGLSKEEAEQKEIELISKHKTNNPEFGYNIQTGGKHGKGYTLSKETREKMSRSRMGEKNWNFGKHLTDEVKKKLSIAHMGKCNIEAIRRGAEKRKGKNAYNARSVVQLDMDGNVIEMFECMAYAREKTGIRIQDIYNCCVGRQKSSHGYKWKYYNEV